MSKRLKIVHVLADSARYSTGPTNAIRSIMQSQILAGLDVVGISPINNSIPSEQLLSIKDFPIFEVDYYNPNQFSATAKSFFDKNFKTIFHFHGIEPKTNAVAKLVKRQSFSYVFTSQGHLLFHGVVHYIKKLIYLNFLTTFISRASGLHFCTQREADRARFLIPRWRGELLIQPNIVKIPDPSKFHALNKEEIGIPSDAFLFAYMGRIHVKHKGLDLIIKALTYIPEDIRPYVIFIGPDDAGGIKTLKKLASKHGCSNKIQFIKSLIGDAKWQTLLIADAFVSPSRWECCSSAQAEAIGFGLPTIISTSTCIAPEVKKHGAASLCHLSPSSLAKKMQEIMKSCGLRELLRESGGNWVREDFSIDKSGPKFTDFYNRVASKI
jgi:glycosyltransferase involved in cell wall biosynthesis